MFIDSKTAEMNAVMNTAYAVVRGGPYRTQGLRNRPYGYRCADR